MANIIYIQFFIFLASDNKSPYRVCHTTKSEVLPCFLKGFDVCFTKNHFHFYMV